MDVWIVRDIFNLSLGDVILINRKKKVKIDILFSIMALRKIEFFSKVIFQIKKRGYLNVGFITFHEAGDRIFEKANVPFSFYQ